MGKVAGVEFRATSMGGLTFEAVTPGTRERNPVANASAQAREDTNNARLYRPALTNTWAYCTIGY